MTNKMELSGYIGDVEMSYAPSGKAYTKFYVKFTNGKDVNGNFQYDFFNCVAFGDLAEEVNGLDTNVLYDITGKLQANKWTNANGENRKSYQLIAFEVARMINASDPAPQTATVPQGKRAPSLPRPTSKPAMFKGPKDKHPF